MCEWFVYKCEQESQVEWRGRPGGGCGHGFESWPDKVVELCSLIVLQRHLKLRHVTFSLAAIHCGQPVELNFFKGFFIGIQEDGVQNSDHLESCQRDVCPSAGYLRASVLETEIDPLLRYALFATDHDNLLSVGIHINSSSLKISTQVTCRFLKLE
jgi:hypothetical protein